MAKHIRDELDNIMKKVKKLFELSSNNPSAEEAAAAALKAQELIAKYNLEMTDEDGNEPFDYISKKGFYTGVDRSWKYSLSSTISKNFRVMHYWNGTFEVVFFGYNRDVMVAVSVYEFLFKICEKNARKVCRQAYKDTGTEKGVYYSYTRGFLTGIRMELDKQCTTLMIVTSEEVKEEFESFSKKSGFTTLYPRNTAGMTEKWATPVFYGAVEDGKNALRGSFIEDKQGGK